MRCGEMLHLWDIAAVTFDAMWRELLPIGRDSTTGGYDRAPFASAERELAAWYAEQAARRGLEVRYDGQGNAVAWTSQPGVDGRDGVLIGSHLDSVNNGGAFDGPLGVVSSFAALDAMYERGASLRRPIGVAMFVEEEGSRFGVACLGSRLATGQLSSATAAELRDRDGIWLLDALIGAGIEPNLGPSPLLDGFGTFVELHVEQGRDLVNRERAVAVASSSWAHGRWRFDFKGEPNHAGATTMDDRHDPMLTYAMTALAANKQARLSGARATFGRVDVRPNVTNAIPERVGAWLDARAEDARLVEEVVGAIERQARDRAIRDGTTVEVTAESQSSTVHFDPGLARRVADILDDAPLISTGAGHDAAILQAAGISSAMLFVRNPTGVSHSPAEHADPADCLAGVEALVAVLTELAA
jgi:beta-ureidopropionase / N-carbamoyl-L-amino-acid hydrolase